MVPMRLAAPRKSKVSTAAIGTIRIGALGLALLASNLLAGKVAAQAESFYTVAKLAVDVTAKSAVEAKAKALAEAQQRAFQIVLRRVAPLGASAQLEVASEELESLIGGLSVRNERLSTTRYIASLDITFNEQAVKELLAGRGIPTSERRGPSIAVMPVTLDGEKVRGAGSSWYQAWMDLDLSHGLVPVTIIQPREGFDAPLVTAILAGDYAAYHRFNGAYSGQPVVLAVGEAKGDGFTLRLAGEDGVGQINFGETLSFSGDEAAVAFVVAAGVEDLHRTSL